MPQKFFWLVLPCFTLHTSTMMQCLGFVRLTLCVSWTFLAMISMISVLDNPAQFLTLATMAYSVSVSNCSKYGLIYSLAALVILSTLAWTTCFKGMSLEVYLLDEMESDTLFFSLDSHSSHSSWTWKMAKGPLLSSLEQTRSNLHPHLKSWNVPELYWIVRLSFLVQNHLQCGYLFANLVFHTNDRHTGTNEHHLQLITSFSKRSNSLPHNCSLFNGHVAKIPIIPVWTLVMNGLEVLPYSKNQISEIRLQSLCIFSSCGCFWQVFLELNVCLSFFLVW